MSSDADAALHPVLWYTLVAAEWAQWRDAEAAGRLEALAETEGGGT